MNTTTPRPAAGPGQDLIPYRPAPAAAQAPRVPFKVRWREAAAAWKGFVRDPMSVHEAWVLTASRAAQPTIVHRAGHLTLFALMLTLPTWVNAWLLWCGRRPTEPAGDAAPATPDADRTRLQRLTDRVTGWWGWHATPMPVDEAWKESRIVHDTRIPGGSDTLGSWWLVSNKTDRPLLFLLLLTITPTGLNGPLLWCTQRPTRRYGLILAVAATAITVSAVAGS